MYKLQLTLQYISITWFMRGITRSFASRDILANFKISPKIFIPVTSIINPAVSSTNFDGTYL